jgi:hypothetical protein
MDVPYASGERAESALLRWAVCSMVAHHNYHRFPATGPKYTAQMLHMWFKHFPGSARDVSPYGLSITSTTHLREMAEHEELMGKALAAKAVLPEESVAQLRAEFESRMPPIAEEERKECVKHNVGHDVKQDTKVDTKMLLAPHAGGVNTTVGGCLRECLGACHRGARCGLWG